MRREVKPHARAKGRAPWPEMPPYVEASAVYLLTMRHTVPRTWGSRPRTPSCTVPPSGTRLAARRRKVIWTLATGIALTALTGCGATTKTVIEGHPPIRPQSPTQERIFAPVSAANGKLTIGVTARPRGYCWTTSENVSGAWRCFVGNLIQDPCFTGPASEVEKTVVCPTEGPWTGVGIEIRLTRPLPHEALSEEARHEAGATTGIPWTLQLADGSHCILLNGASTEVDHLRFNYTCKPDNLDLYGPPDRSSSAWTIYAGPANASQLTTVPIAVAWY